MDSAQVASMVTTPVRRNPLHESVSVTKQVKAAEVINLYLRGTSRNNIRRIVGVTMEFVDEVIGLLQK